MLRLWNKVDGLGSARFFEVWAKSMRRMVAVSRVIGMGKKYKAGRRRMNDQTEKEVR